MLLRVDEDSLLEGCAVLWELSLALASLFESHLCKPVLLCSQDVSLQLCTSLVLDEPCVIQCCHPERVCQEWIDLGVEYLND